MISWDLTGLPGLLTGDYVPVDALDEAFEEIVVELYLFLIVCVAGFTVCETSCAILNLLSVRVLSLRNAFMCCVYLVSLSLYF